MAFGSYRDDRRRPVVLIDYADDAKMTAAHADWEHPRRSVLDALQVFATNPRNMSALGRTSATNVSALKAAKTFEISTEPRSPLAIWYNGMLEACRTPDRVIDQLSK
jgi:hypothetical protein